MAFVTVPCNFVIRRRLSLFSLVCCSRCACSCLCGSKLSIGCCCQSRQFRVLYGKCFSQLPFHSQQNPGNGLVRNISVQYSQLILCKARPE